MIQSSVQRVYWKEVNSTPVNVKHKKFTYLNQNFPKLKSFKTYGHKLFTSCYIGLTNFNTLILAWINVFILSWDQVWHVSVGAFDYCLYWGFSSQTLRMPGNGTKQQSASYQIIICRRMCSQSPWLARASGSFSAALAWVAYSKSVHYHHP